MEDSRVLNEKDRKGAEVDPAVPELVARAQRGDHASFERLYRLHVGWVYAICLRMIADKEQAETLTQDVFVRVWEKLGSYGRRGSFGGWLRRLAINVVIESWRAEARWSKWRDLDGEAAGMHAGGSHGVSHPGDAIDLERAIRCLPDGARSVFVLHDVYGYRHREIAEMMGLSSGTARAQLHRARKLLRGALGESRSKSREVMGQ
ncbi:MAG: RNA polymerase sigma factor [Candidatus Eisenbacteria sp.]|nr:RNA polymerase sigma factor [Candidatus Eisenbacteria bacterium]